jgi:hypothetical protein
MAGKDIFIMQRNADDTGWETKTIPASNDGVLATNISGSLEAVTKASLALGSETGSLVRNDQTSSMSVASASIATTAQSVHYDNVTNKPTLISGSAQIADEISGSFNEFSASAAIVASTVIKHSTQLVSLQSATSSYALSANISGAFAADSSSLASRLDIVEGGANVYISASNQNVDFGQVTATRLTVVGKITANEIHTTLTSASIVYQSGSTQFGNSADDTHTFTGNITASGIINASAFVGDGSGLTGIVSGGSGGGTIQSGSSLSIIAADSGSGGLGGNKRGSSVTDLQTCRSAGDMVSSGNWSVIVGGRNNKSSGTQAVVIGGNQNCSEASNAFVGNGQFNRVLGLGTSVIVSGNGNEVNGYKSAIVTGQCNCACEWNNFIGAGSCNGISNTGRGTVILSGCVNKASSCYGGIITGKNNCLQNNYSFILGTGITTNANNHTFVQGLNVAGHVTASGVVSASAFIGDGSQLTGISSGGSGGTLQSGSAVALILVDSGSGGGGGNPRGGSAVDLQRQRNRATQVAGGFFSFVVGRGNSATSTSAGAVGGEYNLVNGAHSVVAGGTYNTGSSVDVFVGGGCRNAAIANSSAIIGGKLNFTCNNTATVVGGCLNAVSGLRSSVIGGQNNCITNTGNDSMIIGGQGNCLIHCNSVILAGTNITSSAINTTYVNNLSITGNLTGNLNVVGHVTASGTVSASAFIGDGSQLTGILAGGLSGSTLQGAPNVSVLGGCAIDGGDVFITAGETTCSALRGGCVIVRGGVNTINRGGDVRIYGGCSTNTFSGGDIVVQGGNNSSTGTSGLAILRGGLGAKGGMGAVDGGSGTTQAGCARLSGGYSLSGTAGNVNVYGGGSTTSPGCVTISGGSGVYFGGSGADVIIRGGLPGGVTCNLGNSGNVTICTPDALGTSKNSGDITIEVGSATGTKGNLKLMSLPTSPAGLPSGSVWRDNAASNTLKIV